jgi:heat-inducible transcriptional repressor
VVLVLDDRKAAILKAIVRNYVRGGEPVGSKRLVEECSLGVSAATVRAEMAALEEAGYITQPYTSAGRIPTDLGYRYFVDSLQGTDATALSAEQRTALEGLLLGSADLEDLLWRATNALSRLTHFAALVAAPRLDRSRIRHIELVRLGPTSVLAVMIADTGRVMKCQLDLETAVADYDVQRAQHAVNEVAVDLRTDQAPEVISGLAAGAPPEVRGLIETVADAIRQGLSGAHPSFEQVFVGGTANIMAGHFHRLEEVKQVYETLEEQMVVLKILREALAVGDPSVRIGAELPFAELAPCSIVAASYEATKDSVGSLGVLGPTRMDYPRTLAAVQAVASSLEKALAELTGGQG